MGARTARSGSAALSQISKKKKTPAKVPIEQYEHKKGKRTNNPPVGLVTPTNDQDTQAKKYFFDPHLDPSLEWAGKKERESLELPIVSLHVHERIDPRSIIEAVRKTNTVDYEQMSLFNKSRATAEALDEIEFYKHSRNWSNRLVAGDSLLVMNSLIEKEGLAGKFQMVYFDPPYGIKYGSNFQPFVNKKEVKDGKDEDLNQEPETLKAFRDTWELGKHSYLSYIRDRILLSRELLTDQGSMFVQISQENAHLVRIILDEVFGADNFVSMIAYATTSGFEASTLSRSGDYILWYARSKKSMKYHQLYFTKTFANLKSDDYRYVEEPNGTRRLMTTEEKTGSVPLKPGARVFRLDNTTSQGSSKNPQPFKMNGKTYLPPTGSHWKAQYPEGMERLKKANRLYARDNSIAYVRYFDDFPLIAINNTWTDTSVAGAPDGKLYVVQTNPKVIERCMLMVTDPGDLVFDPTCGSGTTAVVAEEWGRRWITCDTSRVAIALAKQRLMTADYPYYVLAHKDEGIDSGLKLKTAKRVTLGAIANEEHPEEIQLVDQPEIDSSRARVTGPFTVEAVPAPTIRPLTASNKNMGIDNSISRFGETLRQAEWRDELLKAGVRGKSRQVLKFANVEPIAGTRWLHAQGQTLEGHPERVVISFGPEYAPLEQKQVALALEEAKLLKPKPDIVIFAAFQFDSEAAKDIDEAGSDRLQVLKAQMNADLLTSDLKKKRSSNESFWLVGQPDVKLTKIKSGEQKGMFEVNVAGFDYYNPVTGEIDSGDSKNIAMWMIDTDYDGQAVFARQVFFPQSGNKDGWNRLAKSLNSEIDEELIEAYGGTKSLPFKSGKHRRIAIKIIDDRGIESIRILDLE